MKASLFSISTIALLLFSFGCAKHRVVDPVSVVSAYEEIDVDGDFSDWNDVASHTLDSVATEEDFALESIRIAHDGAGVHLMFALDQARNIQGLDGTLELLLDIDGDSGTGAERARMAGVDLVVQFTPPNLENPEERGMGIGVVPVGRTKVNSVEEADLRQSDLGSALAPTYASKQIEISLARGITLDGLPRLFAGTNFNAKVVLVSKNRTTMGGSDVLNYALSPLDTTLQEQQLANELPVKASDSLRVVSWNVEFGTILKKPDIYRRMLEAIEPDVLLLQELSPTNSAVALAALLNSVPSDQGGEWQVILGGDEDDPIRCGMATRFPLERIDEITFVPYPNRPDRFVRALGGEVSLPNGKKLLATSIHLKCCGRIESYEDDTRQLEVELINAAVAKYVSENPVDGIVMGGDLNLVGGYQPIESLAEKLDHDGADLGIVEPFRLNGRSNATWENPWSRFAPGRLDYLLVSESTMSAGGSFVFNTKDVSSAALSSAGLIQSDSVEASDHYPIVVDLNWEERVSTQ